MAKILCVLYPDPEGGYPPVYARDAIPTITGDANIAFSFAFLGLQQIADL